MGKINIDDVKPGMTLASDLVSPNGRFLFAKGTPLDEKRLRIMKIWDITEADIQDVSREEACAAAERAFSPEILAQSDEYVNILFRPALSDHDATPGAAGDAVQELRRLCLRKVAERLAAGQTLPALCEPAEYPAADAHIALPEESAPVSAKAIARRENQLASFPDIYFQIMDVLNNPRSPLTLAADAVSKDTSLTAKLLRVVNSPFYGFASRVDSIHRAVTLVGANELSMLALGVSVVQYFQDIAPGLVDMKRFWKHSIAAGVFGRILASHKRGLSEERFFLGGLIHDIGRLVILKNYPQITAKAYALSCAKPCLLYEAEREVMGFDHAEVAGRLLEAWQFPSGLEQMVRLHHAPETAAPPIDAAIIHLADIMARTLAIQALDIAYVPPLNEQAWRALELASSVLASVYSQAEHLIEDIYQTFLGQPSSVRSPEDGR